MESAEDDDFFDDWLINSMNSYKHLYMFELPQPTCVIEWNESNGIFVASCNPTGNVEVLEMSIPGKLLNALSSKAEGLTKDRDFKMLRGGFSDKPIHCLKYLEGSQPRLIVTGSHSSQNVDLWQLGTETSDVIRKLSTLPGQGTKGVRTVGQRVQYANQVAFGSSHSDLQVVDVKSNKVIAKGFGEAEDVVEIQFMNDNELVICNSRSGNINIHDLRTTSESEASTDLMKESLVKKDTPSTESSQSCASLETSSLETSHQECKSQDKEDSLSWTFDLVHSESDTDSSSEDVCKKPRMDAAMPAIVRLSSRGEIIRNDLRNLQEPVYCVRVADEKLQHKDCGSLMLRCCPTERHLLSVSGLSNCVDIYDTSKWQQSLTSPQTVVPIFSHEGHVSGDSANQNVRILCHSWHPWQPRVMMSSGDDCSLHAWEWAGDSE